MADVVLLGSSHIVKLKQYIDSDVKFKNFEIKNIIVEYCGIPGGRLANPDHIERFQNFILDVVQSMQCSSCVGMT